MVSQLPQLLGNSGFVCVSMEYGSTRLRIRLWLGWNDDTIIDIRIHYIYVRNAAGPPNLTCGKGGFEYRGPVLLCM